MIKFKIIGQIEDIETIGKLSNEVTKKSLNSKYGNTTWIKRKGIAFIEEGNRVRKAEIHWIEAHGKGRYHFKIKRYLS